MIIAVTELRLKSIRHYFKAMCLSIKARKEAVDASGNLGVKTSGKGFLVLNTLTAWESEEALKAYVRSPHHATAMKFTAQIAREVRSTHFRAEAMPAWKEARRYLGDNTIKFTSTKLAK